MSALAYQTAKLAGQALVTQAAAAGGDTLPVSGKGALLVQNGSASPVTVTVVVPGNTAYGEAEPDVPVVVAAGASALIGPLPQGLADPADGLVHFSYSAVASVTVAGVQVG